MSYYLLHGIMVPAVVLPVLVFSTLAVRLIYRDREPLFRLAAGLLGAFLLVDLIGGILGLCGALTLTGYAVAGWLAVIILGSVYFLRARKIKFEVNYISDLPAAPWPLAALGLVALAQLAGMLAVKLVLPAMEYDELTYHLHFPAQWLVEKKIFLIDTPFGDAAPAYAPANGELWYAWLMAPMRGSAADLANFKLMGLDAVAKIGQFPFFILAAVALILLARRLKAEGWAIYLPAILFAFMPWVLTQSASASVDLMMSACLLGALALAFEYQNHAQRRIAALSGVALGLAVGVKFVALSYAPLMALPMLIFLWRNRDGRSFAYWVLGLLAAGAPWYLRNLALTGNPLFPMQVSLFGANIFPGAYTRAAMLQSPFHAPDVASALAVGAHAIGFWLVSLAIIGIVCGFFWSRGEKSWRMIAWLAPVAWIWHFLIVPYSSQDRFLIWVVALSFLPLCRWPAARRWRILLWVLLIPALALTLIGPGFSFQIGALPVPKVGTLLPQGWWVGLPTLALMGLLFFYIRKLGRPLLSIGVVFGVGVIMALVMAKPAGGMYVRTGAKMLSEMPLNGYLAIWERHPQKIAYAGRNTPYYLVGRSGLTRVYYINADGRTDWLLHDYVHQLSATGRLDLHKEKDDWRGRNPDFQYWQAALLRTGITMLFLEPLSPAESLYLPGDTGGYPLERDWARSHPESFSLIDCGKRFELYKINR